jgi:predicted ATP-grasp superfamily ATP-dependent carboligase
MIKPRRGAGGWRNAVVGNSAELAAWESANPDMPYIRQEIVDGIPASVCCVADGTRAKAITTNEQVLRGEKDARFGFCGSITPFVHPSAPAMIALAEKIAAASGCIGTIGIDFVCGIDRCYAIEVNPRFQATVDTVEAALDCNLFNLHVDACKGQLPSRLPSPKQVVVRSILFAGEDITIRNDLKALSPAVADIPWPGTSFEKDQAIVSVFGRGPDRNAALATLDKNITTVRQYMR